MSSLCRSRRPEGGLVAAVQQAILAVLVRPVNPSHFSQGLYSFNCEEQTCSVLVWYQIGPKKATENEVKCPTSSRRARSSLLFCVSSMKAARSPGYCLDSYRTGCLLGTERGRSLVLEILLFSLDTLQGRSLFRF